jgi:hypothetical protein
MPLAINPVWCESRLRLPQARWQEADTFVLYNAIKCEPCVMCGVTADAVLDQYICPPALERSVPPCKDDSYFIQHSMIPKPVLSRDEAVKDTSGVSPIATGPLSSNQSPWEPRVEIWLTARWSQQSPWEERLSIAGNPSQNPWKTMGSESLWEPRTESGLEGSAPPPQPTNQNPGEPKGGAR